MKAPGAWLLCHIPGARALWRRLVLELGNPHVYTSEEEIAEQLRVADTAHSALLLAEAEEVDRRMHADAESLERRATTLQGAVAIAVTITLAAGGLLFDRTKLSSSEWRISFAALLLSSVVSFIASGLRALGASSTTYPWAYPGFNDIFQHAKSETSEARAAKAAAHLKSAGANLRIVQVKGGYLNAAVRWFRVALFLLLLLAVWLLLYSIVGPKESA
jgi:hypothetical protein